MRKAKSRLSKAAALTMLLSLPVVGCCISSDSSEVPKRDARSVDGPSTDVVNESDVSLEHTDLSPAESDADVSVDAAAGTLDAELPSCPDEPEGKPCEPGARCRWLGDPCWCFEQQAKWICQR